MNHVEQHLRSITPSNPTGSSDLVFFDLDRTLIAGYSILALASETIRHSRQQGELRQTARVVSDVIQHKIDASGSNYHRLVRRLT